VSPAGLLQKLSRSGTIHAFSIANMR
jgi:hypothetical protein